jgi:hypothetical protein
MTIQVIPGIMQRVSAPTAPRGPTNAPDSRLFGRMRLPIPPTQAAGSVLGDGRVVVVYEHPVDGVFARIVLPDDTLSPEIYVDDKGSAASVAMGIDGTFAVVWQRDAVSMGRSVTHILIRTYNPDGSPKYSWPVEPEIATGHFAPLGLRRSQVSWPSVAALYDGKFAVIWNQGFHGITILPSFPWLTAVAQSDIRYCIYDPVTRSKSPDNISLQITSPTRANFPSHAQITELSTLSPGLLAWSTGREGTQDTSSTGSYQSCGTGICSKDGTIISASDYFTAGTANMNLPTIVALGVTPRSTLNCVVPFNDPTGHYRFGYMDWVQTPHGTVSDLDDIGLTGNVGGTYLGVGVAVTALLNGKFILAQEVPLPNATYNDGIRGRVCGRTGAEGDEFPIGQGDGYLPSLASTPDGFYAVWMKPEPSIPGLVRFINGQRFRVTYS